MQYINGPLLVVGGAGSGKTSLLVHKIAWLVREYETPPGRICVIASNASAVRRIRSRVAAIVGRQLPDLWVTTFGELALAVIENRLDALGLWPGYSLYDRSDAEAVVARLLRETRPDSLGLAAAVTQQIARWKRELTPPRDDIDASGTSAATIAAGCYLRYEQRLRMANAVDVDGIAGKAVELLKTDSRLLEEWRARFGFVLIDEYERAQTAEHELTTRWTEGGPVLTAVADDGPWLLSAGATGDHLARLRAEHKNLRVIRLAGNVRSTARIARAAAALLGSRDTRAGEVARPAERTERLRVLQARNEQQEADGLVAALVAHKGRSGEEYRDYAIVVPSIDDTALIERALQSYRVPYHVRGGASLFDQAEVRDLRAYLRLLCNASDDVAFLRAVNTPRRDIDRVALENLLSYAARRQRPLLECAYDPELAQTLTPGRFAVLHGVATLLRGYAERAVQGNPIGLIYDLVAELRYEDWLRDACNDLKLAQRRMQAVTELIEWLRRVSKQQPRATVATLVTQLNRAAIFDPEPQESMVEGVALLPVERAKGQEFAHVYIAAFEEGWLPDVSDAEREPTNIRRWAHVALSCARESATFTLAEQRRIGGDFVPRRPNRLLTELASDDLEWVSAPPESASAEALLGAPRRPSGGYPRGLG